MQISCAKVPRYSSTNIGNNVFCKRQVHVRQAEPLPNLIRKHRLSPPEEQFPRSSENATDWNTEHEAVAMTVEGHVKVGALLPMPGPPKIGYRIYFAEDNNDGLTSPLVAIARPHKTTVAQYPS